MGLVIKSPKKAAAEYAKHSVSIYRHCPNQCAYCYLDKGISKGTLGSATRSRLPHRISSVLMRCVLFMMNGRSRRSQVLNLSSSSTSRWL